MFFHHSQLAVSSMQICFGCRPSPSHIDQVASTQIINLRTCCSTTKLHLFGGLAVPAGERTCRCLQGTAVSPGAAAARPGPAQLRSLRYGPTHRGRCQRGAVRGAEPRRLRRRGFRFVSPPSPIVRAPASVHSSPYGSHKQPATSFAASPRQPADSLACCSHRGCPTIQRSSQIAGNKNPPGPLPRL